MTALLKMLPSNEMIQVDALLGLASHSASLLEVFDPLIRLLVRDERREGNLLTIFVILDRSTLLEELRKRAATSQPRERPVHEVSP